MSVAQVVAQHEKPQKDNMTKTQRGEKNLHSALRSACDTDIFLLQLKSIWATVSMVKGRHGVLSY